MESPLSLRAAIGIIPMYKGSTFVIKINGDLIENNFSSIAEDIALLHAVGIKIVILFGCQQQIQKAIRTTKNKNHSLKEDGYMVTSPEILKSIKGICTAVQLEIVAGLTKVAPKTNCFTGNIVRAKKRGVVSGVDFQLTGEVDIVNSQLLQQMLDQDMITVISPLATDQQGEILHLMSDEVAAQVAISIGARKLIFMTNVDGIYVHSELIRHIKAEDVKELLADDERLISGNILFKVNTAIRACNQGIPRVHIINGKQDGALLSEIFSRDGIGTLIYSDAYAQIRSATTDDIPTLVNMAKPYTEEGTVIKKTIAELAEVIDEILIFEKDQIILGCCILTVFKDDNCSEISYLAVDQSCHHQGIATKLLKFAEEKSLDLGLRYIFALTTKAESWFVNLQFREGSTDILPNSRREAYDKTRRSKVMAKEL